MTSNLKVGTTTIGNNKLYLGNTKVTKIYLGDGDVVYQLSCPRWIEINNLHADKDVEDLDFYNSCTECNYVGEIKYNGIYYPIYTPVDYGDPSSGFNYEYILLLTPLSSIQFNSCNIYEDYFDGDFQYLMDHLDDSNAEEMWVNTVYLDSDRSTVVYDNTYPKHDKDYIIQSGD